MAVNMSTSTRVRAIGRGLAYIGLLLLALRLARYLVDTVALWAGYLGGVLFVVGVCVWFFGAVMVGYAEPEHKDAQS